MTRQNVIDQLLHVLAAIAVVLLAHMGVVGGMLAGFGCGLIRELSEAGGSRITLPEVKAHFTKGKDPYIDLASWAVGGALAGIFVG